MIRYLAALMIFQGVWFVQNVIAQDAATWKDLGGVVAFTGYPGSLLFQNAFHRNRSTRFLLLKAIASNPDLAKRLDLSETQIADIKTLHTISKEISNESPDETEYEPKYFSFLNQSQQDRLMILALHFDGLAALSHKSIAERIPLEEATLGTIRKIVNRQRDTVLLPNFRVRFARNPSKQEVLTNADFDIRLIVLTNFEIAAVLSPRDLEMLGRFMKNESSLELIDLIKSMAELPEGLDHLHSLIKD